jgi:hypothetical protein
MPLVERVSYGKLPPERVEKRGRERPEGSEWMKERGSERTEGRDRMEEMCKIWHDIEISYLCSCEIL